MTSLALLWTGWCILHSLLISETVNSRIRKQGGILQGLYRILYILFSIISLVPVLWYQYKLPQQLLFSWSCSWLILQAVLLVYAAIMFYGGTRVYDIGFFLGTSQWYSYRQKRAITPLPFSCHNSELPHPAICHLIFSYSLYADAVSLMSSYIVLM